MGGFFFGGSFRVGRGLDFWVPVVPSSSGGGA